MNQIKELLDKNPATIHFDFYRNDIQSIQALADALKINTTLMSLNLQNKQISYQGIQILAEALKINTSLTILDMHSNQFGDQGVQLDLTRSSSAPQLSSCGVQLDLTRSSSAPQLGSSAPQ
jgi:Ran GTPase-activating protein (RanGAP) involved in mRNA processing and transport